MLVVYPLPKGLAISDRAWEWTVYFVVRCLDAFEKICKNHPTICYLLRPKKDEFGNKCSTIMRILFAFFLILATSIAAVGHTLGELIDLEGKKCLVIAIDSINGKALVMAPPAIFIEGKTNKEIEKKILKDKNFKDFYAAGGLSYVPAAPDTKEYKQLKKDASKVIKDTKEKWNLWKGLTGEYEGQKGGRKALLKNQKDNEEAINAFLSGSNKTLEDLYPEYAWAKSLGEGWFLGGPMEFLTYHNLIGGFDQLYKLRADQEASGYTFFYPLNLQNAFYHRYAYQPYSRWKEGNITRFQNEDPFLSEGEVFYQGENRMTRRRYYNKIWPKGEKEFGKCAIACRWIE